MKTKLFLGLAFLLPIPVSFAACGGGEAVNPAPTGTQTATSTTTSSTTTEEPDAGPPQDGAPPKRTVFLRDPLGGPANNLLLDGDFELSSSYGTGQYGWRKFDTTGTGELLMTLETGGLCRTGLSCVKLSKGQILFGRGTAAALGKPQFMEAYARMSEGVKCNKVSVLAVECDSFQVLKQAAQASEPENGWCRHFGAILPSQYAICLYIQSSLKPGEEALIDSAVLGPNDGTVPHAHQVSPPLDPETLQGMANLRDLLRRTTRFDAPRNSRSPE